MCGQVLSESGDVYTWGSPEYGRLGHSDEKPRMSPTLVEFLRGRKSVREYALVCPIV